MSYTKLFLTLSMKQHHRKSEYTLHHDFFRESNDVLYSLSRSHIAASLAKTDHTSEMIYAVACMQMLKEMNALEFVQMHIDNEYLYAIRCLKEFTKNHVQMLTEQLNTPGPVIHQS